MIYRKIVGDITVEFEGTENEILHIINSEAKGNVTIKPSISLAERESIIETISEVENILNRKKFGGVGEW